MKPEGSEVLPAILLKPNSGSIQILKCLRVSGGIPTVFMSVSEWCAISMNIQEKNSFQY
jgi:hypothetical protein